MGSSPSRPTPPRIAPPFTHSHPYILSIPISNLSKGCFCSSVDFLTAVVQDPASAETYVTKCEYNMSGDLSSHHWLVVWLAREEDADDVAVVVWDADHDLEAKESGRKGNSKLTLHNWADIFPPTPSGLESETYLATRKNVTTVATQPYPESTLTLLDFALLAQTVQKLYPTLHAPGLPCRWAAHITFRAMAALQNQHLPAAYIGRIKGFDEAQVELVVRETKKALKAYWACGPPGEGERMQCAAGVEKKVRERKTLIYLSGDRER